MVKEWVPVKESSKCKKLGEFIDEEEDKVLPKEP